MMCSSLLGLVTLEEMKLRREILVQEREKKLAAALAADEAEKQLVYMYVYM